MDLCGRRDNEFPGFVSAQEKSLLVILSGWEGGLPVGEKVTRFYFTEEAGQAMQSLVWVSRMGITLTGIPAIVIIHVWVYGAYLHYKKCSGVFCLFAVLRRWRRSSLGDSMLPQPAHHSLTQLVELRAVGRLHLKLPLVPETEQFNITGGRTKELQWVRRTDCQSS